MDETSIKVKKVGMYLYREVDSEERALEYVARCQDGQTFLCESVCTLLSVQLLKRIRSTMQVAQPTASARRLTLAKYTVITITRHPETLTDLHVALRLPLDDTDSASVASATEVVVRRFGRIDILVFRVYFMQTFGSL